eukprot:TRINITY_DN1234_c0_g1_i6.p1 TRINITY_DN1234_c0_g1~~TRINITY_DN1234_c0_g1_i6.p1  ORF type:complete len:309 (-),score=35.35 TRINITY_DN1234_c0_g1_i6:1226-2152(-)
MESGETLFLLKSLLAGGIAGMAGKSCVAPLDRVKILLQTQKSEFSHYGITSSLVWIVKTEGIFGLFRGNLVQMIRIFPYGGIQFSTYEFAKKILCKDEESTMSRGHWSKFAAGSLGGVCGITATYPLDTLRARLAFYSKADAEYRSLFSAATTIYHQKEGIFGFYRGLFPSILAIIPQSGLSFYFFELLKGILLWKLEVFRVLDHQKDDDHYHLSIPGKLIAGGLAGALAQSICYPLDVARRRMQMGQGDRLISVLKNTYREHGISKGLYRGMSVNFVRSVPLNAVSFCVYESCKQLFGTSTSLKISL